MCTVGFHGRDRASTREVRQVRYSLIAVTVMALVAGCMGTSYADAMDFYTPPLVSAPLMADAPNIDGMLEPNEWAQAGTVSKFIMLGGRSEPSAQTEMWIGYDPHNLYIAAMLHDPSPNQIKAEVTQRDGAVYSEDCLELFFDPANDGEQYIHFIINPLGTRYDALKRDETVDYRWEAKTARLESGWSVEMSLPFEGGIPPSLGAVWGFVAARNVPHLGQLSASSRLLQSFHEPENFGAIRFARRPAMMKLAAVGDGLLGDNKAAIVVINPNDEPLEGKVHVRVMAPGKRGNSYDLTKVKINPGKGGIVQVPYTIRQDGLNTLQVSLTDATGQVISRTPPYPVTLPPVGAELADLESALSAGLRVWSMLDDAEYKERAARKFAVLTATWQDLADCYRDERRGMSRAGLAGLQDEIAALTSKAELLRLEIDAYMQTQASGGVRALSFSALTDIAPGEQLPHEVEAYLSVARNSRAALQMVVLPFRKDGEAE
jgi:hypothetical protein